MQIKVKEIKKPEIDAKIIGIGVARQIEGRSPYKRILKQAVTNGMRAGVKGIKVQISGRLGGAEMARKFEVKDGSIPLQTLRADIDYSLTEANTVYGVIGVKVWVCKGEVFGVEKTQDAGSLIKTKNAGASEVV